MYKIFFKNSNRRYYYGLPVPDLGKAVWLSIEFKAKVPYIMVTNSDDHSIYECENGAVVFPDDHDFSSLSPLGLVDQIPEDVCEIPDLVKRRNQVAGAIESADFIYAEAVLLVAAITLDIDLYRYGWARP